MNYLTPGYETLELSTQITIKEALQRGYKVEVLDSADNFIRIRGRGKIEYIKQATKTSKDSYISPLIMENKSVSKLLMAEAGIRVPEGDSFTESQVNEYLNKWKNRSIVVKPKSTNFGKGVAVLQLPYTENQFLQSAEKGFQYDSELLIEEFIPGEEFRFLVIGDKVPGVLQRIPANVIGNNSLNIQQLVSLKNQNPLRGTGYVSPLEKITLSEYEIYFLKQQGLTPQSVPGDKETIFLRENSNISTGGDSIDFTDKVHPGYKEIALAAAAAAGAQISGIDIISADITAEPEKNNYAVIELNFNPAIHIHNFPWIGKNRHIEMSLFNLLDL